MAIILAIAAANSGRRMYYGTSTVKWDVSIEQARAA
jgi:hypothetical protein